MCRRTLAAVAAAWVLGGCVYIPLDRYTPASRTNVSEEAPKPPVVPGSTSREAVLVALGEPDGYSMDEREFLYVAIKLKGMLIGGSLGGPGGGGSGGIPFFTAFRHVIRFDERHLVESYRLELVKYHEAARHGQMPAVSP